MAEAADLLIKGWYVVTMNETRDIIRDGAVVVRGNEIVAVGKASDLEREYDAAETLGGDRFVVTPGMVNTHIHITGEPLTRGYVPDDTPFEENVFMWLCPLYSVYSAEEERLSAQLAAVEMLKSGTTTFLEAGTIRFLDEVVDGLVEVGGCLTGEHGVGIEKRDLMDVQFDPVDLEAQMQVKDVFDPAWLLNPAKVFPLTTSAARREAA